MGAGKREGALHVAGLPNDAEPALEVQHAPQTAPDQWMVVGEHDRNLLRSRLDRIRHTGTVLPNASRNAGLPQPTLGAATMERAGAIRA